MTRLMIALPLTLATLAAGPALSETLRDQVRESVAERTEARLETRETLPPGQAAEHRLDVIDTRLDRREEVDWHTTSAGPTSGSIRRGTRIETRLAD
jgi:hypothetical protein